MLVGSVALTLGLLVLVWWVSWQRLEAERQLLDQNARVQQENLAAIIAENLSQVFDRGRLMSIAANEWFEGNRINATQRLSAMRAADRAFLRIALYDRVAQRVYSSSPSIDTPGPAVSLLRPRLAAALPAEVMVGERPASPEHAWQLPLFFPVTAADGRLHGVLLVVLDLGYFLALYQDIDIGRSGIIRLLKADGEPLAEARQAGLVLDAPTGERIVPGGARQGSLHGRFFEPGRLYLSSFRQLDRHPFTVTVSRAVDETLAAHLASRARFLGVLAALSGLLAVAAFWFIRSLGRQGRLLSALAAADVEKRELIVQLEEEKRRAFALAAHDHLTGLPNRRMFHELVVSHLSRAKRSRKYYVLMYLDLDRFKGINDTLGHHVGDLLLQAVAERLRGCLRESDVIARLGGDEFGLLLTGLENIDDSATVAAKLVEQVSLPCIDLDGNDIQISPSIGIAIYPRDGDDFETLCRHADAAMYRAKHAGRGRFCYFDPTLNQIGERLFNLEQRLPRALAGNELLLHFQPLVRLTDFRVVGFEALLRWQHPDFGLIYPADFVPLAENAGFIAAIGDWVIAACCRQQAEWQAAGLELVPLACNISASQLHDEDLPRRVAERLAEHGVDGRHLAIEITESSLLASPVVAGRVLRCLEALGIGIALDDFGNGFSHLANIRHLPIHYLKIDRAFISDIRNRPDDAVIVASIITLAHNLEMQVVAEGVEMLDQLVHLKTAGCDTVQGYYLSRPVEAAAARHFLIHPILNPA